MFCIILLSKTCLDCCRAAILNTEKRQYLIMMQEESLKHISIHHLGFWQLNFLTGSLFETHVLRICAKICGDGSYCCRDIAIYRMILQNSPDDHGWYGITLSKLRISEQNMIIDMNIQHTHARTHTHLFNGPLSGTTQVSQYQKGKTIWILLKQKTVSGSGISWAICKSAPGSRQITMPAPHHSVFYRPDALPATQPTAMAMCDFLLV